MPSIAQALPLGLNGLTMVGLPERSQYCVAICPFLRINSSSDAGATILPSPWETGTEYTSPTLQPESQGLSVDATLISTIVDTWREMLL